MQIVMAHNGVHLFGFALFVIQILICFSTTAITNISTDQSALVVLKSRLNLHPSHILLNNWSVSTSVCSWVGVTCGSRHQRVTGLDISSMRLAGNLPPETGNLSFLVSFNLSGNYFRGNLPQEMSRLRRLQVIDISVNNFTGELPSWFQFLGQLRFLNLGNNSFSGPLPSSIANILKLEKLDLSFNSLNGEIPRGIGNVHNLKELNLRYNGFSGTIPAEVFNISKLEILSLRGNSFSGGLPADMCRGIPWIQELRLSENQLDGQIPSTISQCSGLRFLYLSYNRFTGPIPREIGNLSALETLALGVNNFAGGIPQELGHLRNVKQLDIGASFLTGPIPESIFNITSLEYLDISNCTLDGTILPEMCPLGSQLETVYLNDNKLVGRLPARIDQCSRLQILALSDNSLTGSIPSSIGNLTMLTELYADYNGFIGRIPESISDASNIAILYLDHNSFIGPILDFGKLRYLQELGLDGNKFISESGELSIITSLTNCTDLEYLSMGWSSTLHGTLPVTIGNLSSSLQHLSIAEMDLYGSIPNEICDLSNLIVLNLGENKLTGSLPHNLTKFPKLQQLSLSGNKLSGMLPSGICELRSLESLSLAKNQIEGSVPDCIGALTTLRHLYMEENRLSSVPKSLWQLEDLLELNLSTNFLIGSLPLDIGNMKALLNLDMSLNQFSSNIPSAIGNLQNLKNLSLADNRFTGYIPETIGNMLSLAHLNLSHNNLSGNIPNSLQSLRDLSSFDVSFNELSGQIPPNGSFKNFANQFYASNEGLCGDPRYGVRTCPKTRSDGSKRRKIVIVVVCVLSGVALLAFVTTLAFIVARYKRKTAPLTQTGVEIETAPIRVSYYDIANSTEGFSESHLIGVGGFSSVYKGTLRDGKLVAIKVLDLKVEGAFTNFDTECELLSSLRHRNLCKIIGVCSNESFKGVVLEYMPNGSLGKLLYSESCFLDVMQRVSIMVDVACALEYLHHGYSVPVVHRDLKPSNVLLDENMVARLSDFGISKLLNEGDSFAQSKTLATFGYMAPEYGSEGLVSTRSDVYSYGIMLMEVFTRLRPSSETFVGELSLKGLVHESWPNEILQVIDSRLLSHEDALFDEKLECVSSIMELALKCSMESPNERMSMKDVVVRLRKFHMKLLTYSQKNTRERAAN